MAGDLSELFRPDLERGQLYGVCRPRHYDAGSVYACQGVERSAAIGIFHAVWARPGACPPPHNRRQRSPIRERIVSVAAEFRRSGHRESRQFAACARHRPGGARRSSGARTVGRRRALFCLCPRDYRLSRIADHGRHVFPQARGRWPDQAVLLGDGLCTRIAGAVAHRRGAHGRRHCTPDPSCGQGRDCDRQS